MRTSASIVRDTDVLEKIYFGAQQALTIPYMFYSLCPAKGLNPRKFCWWDPRSGIFYLWNLESWALESRIQPKKSRIPLTTDIQFHLRRRRRKRKNVNNSSCSHTYFALRDCSEGLAIESPAVPLYPPSKMRYLSPSLATLKVEYSAYEILPSKSSRSTLSMTSRAAVKQ